VDNRTHLIERAAARLEGFGAPFGASAPARDFALRPTAAPVERTLREIARPVDASETALKPGGVLNLEALAEAGLISPAAPYDRVAEEFRIIQSKILRQGFGTNGAAAGIPNSLVMITSALKGEGKSFCSLNLAGEIARQGDRQVLLVDTDPKPDGLAQQLGTKRELGLLDLARRTGLNIEALTIPTEIDGLSFLPFGTNVHGSAELFASRRMADTIIEIGRRNPERLVIFDAPPSLGSSTPHTLASIMGQIVLVVAASRTQETDVRAALDLLQACPHVSLLLNKLPAWLAHSFGSYAYSAERS
jgi:Mrp family chromosome partitioning ATPase